MKVGILTMHRVVNYGSFMQAYALKRYIEAMGHEVEFRDFPSGQPRHVGQKVVVPGLFERVATIPKKLLNMSETLKRRAFRQKRGECFKTVCWPLLGLPARPNYDLKMDAIIIGSDEVFNYTQNHVFGYVPCLFGHGIKAAIIASYAASAGYTNWDDVQRDGMADELKRGLACMTGISVRDENTRALVENCTGTSPTMVLDPTLIYDFSSETSLYPVLAPGYLLVYAYEGRMDSAEEIEAIRAFAIQEGLRVVSAGFYHEWCSENVVVGPFDLLRVFADAAYVVTDTFHGSIFSLKAEKRFATFIRETSPRGSNSNKVQFLLDQLGMSSRILSDTARLADVLRDPAPYDVCRSRLAGLQETSRTFLTSVFPKVDPCPTRP
jgi:hypothetical protein